MKQRRRTVGLVVDQIASLVDQDFFQNIIISGVADVMRRMDMNLFVFVVGKLQSPYGWESSRNILMEYVDSGRLDGLIVLSNAIAGYVDKESIGDLLQSYPNLPIVSIGEAYDTIPSVISGGYEAMRSMVDHLIEVHGKRKFAFIKGPDGGHESEVRFAAFKDSLAAHGIPYEDERMFIGNYLYDSGQRAIRHFHKNGIEYDALVCSNDNMALGAISELKRMHGYLPANLSIVGFDDAVFASPLGLTTVRQNFRQQANVAAELLCKLMDGEQADIRHELANTLVVRSSCGCVPSVIVNAFRNTGGHSPAGFGRLSGGVSGGSAGNIASGTPGASPSDFTRNGLETFTSPMSGRSPVNIDRRDVERLKRIVLGEIGESVTLGAGEDTGGRYGRNPAPGSEAKDAALLRELQERLADTLVDGILLGQSLPFYQTMDQYLNYLRDTNRPLGGLHNWLSRLREKTLELLPIPDLVPFAEDLFHSARVHISYSLGKYEASHYFLSSLQTAQLEQFSELMFSAMHYREQMKRTEELLAKYGIRYAFVALYEDLDNPLDRSRLILEIQNGQWVELGDGLVFPTLDLLPDSALKKMEGERLDLVLQVLYHGEARLGYTLFSFDDRVTRYYEVINNRLSIALKNAKHIMEEKNYSQKLERQVAERTKELTDANAKLLQEIGKRQEAEDKLRKALEELAVLNAELRAISIRDELTGLLNRRGFMEQSREAIRKFTESGKGYVVMFADMDNLKKINDRYGHGEGDIAIIRAANLLRAALPNDTILARLGGDEFTAVIPIQSNCREAPVVMQERIADQFAKFNRTSNCAYEMSISLGFACCEQGSTEEFEELLILADNRLYEQKKMKRRA